MQENKDMRLCELCAKNNNSESAQRMYTNLTSSRSVSTVINVKS